MMTGSSSSLVGRSSWALRAWFLLHIFNFFSNHAVVVQSSTASSPTSTISHSSDKLPTSMLSVIAELEDQGCDQFVTACLLTSQGVTQSQKTYLIKTLFAINDDEDDDAAAAIGSTAIGTPSTTQGGGGLVVAISSSSSSSLAELDVTADACAQTLLYYASSDDLSRGEGLFHTLGPVMERLVWEADQNKDSSAAASLIVLCDNEEINKTRDQLERAVVSILSNLITSSNRKLTSLNDVFQSVQYVSLQKPEQVEQAMLSLQKREPTQVAQSMNAPGSSSSSSSSSNGSLLSAADLAAARQLGPAARSALNSALATVRDATSSREGSDDNSQLVTSFGNLCDAAIQRALEEFNQLASPSSLLSTAVGKQIRANLRQELYAELGDLFQQQLALLQTASFEQFRKDLSQLRVSAILGQDMDQVIAKSLVAFSQAAQKLQAKGTGSSWSSGPAKLEFRRRIKEYSRDRLLAARASGQFRPIPRKGVNVGFHWLFPKPFGNDYRQDPWMVHATDNLVYVPKDKITDVTPEEVRSGNDWRRKIVPSPAGNDMIYMQ